MPVPLGEFTVEQFLDVYWQKQPCLIRQAIPGFQPELDGDDLAGLACEPLAESLADLTHGAPLFIFLLALAGFVVMLTEVASNTASTALLVPIYVSVAEAMGLSPATMAAVVAISASCAFMLPVATPPNAVIFGSGAVEIRHMLRAGIILDVVGILIVAVAILTLGQLLFA